MFRREINRFDNIAPFAIGGASKDEVKSGVLTLGVLAGAAYMGKEYFFPGASFAGNPAQSPAQIKEKLPKTLAEMPP